eukprot:CAMPEP_0185407136 /NCGR_PEP_ID=MMETSP1365-20130426/1115_1 /TAXON_ID=38817 /ORGANISM="Gephyrocapsa oceanica, Strain RCC1303" /LENGTH=175 /DNA_ID=CAMNT_0028009533 /DNA_START=82 /DNA_END=610 /DNA_ORIENTATION=-
MWSGATGDTLPVNTSQAAGLEQFEPASTKCRALRSAPPSPRALGGGCVTPSCVSRGYLYGAWRRVRSPAARISAAVAPPAVTELVHNVDGATFNRVLRVIDDLYLEHSDVTFAAHGSATVTALASEICESSPELVTKRAIEDGGTTPLHIDSCGGHNVFRDAKYITDQLSRHTQS